MQTSEPLPPSAASKALRRTPHSSSRPTIVRTIGCGAIGAMAGGFAEYLGMATGNHALSYLIIAAYAGSLLCMLRAAKAAAPA